MKLLIHCIHYPVCSGRYMVEAYRRLGHEVYHVGECMGRHIWGLALPPEYNWEPEPPPEGWEPDLAILMDTAYQWHHETAPTIVHSVDNHVRNLRQSGIERYFLAHRHASVMDWEDDITHLPCAYDPTLHTPSPIPYFEREFDVCMIGVMYPHRWTLVQKLRDAGLKVLAGTGLVYEAYVEAYHNSRVSLCVSAAGDLAQRVFETAAMGCCVLTDPVADLVHEETNEALGLKGFVVYDSEELLIANALELAREPIGEKGAKAIQASVKKHTWDNRAQEIIEWYRRRPF